MKNDNLLSMYDGAFEAWKARLAISRIKAMGFPRQDWGDLMQDLAVLIIEFKYDPERSNGAKEETALYAAISRHLLFVMRGRCRDRRAFEQYLRRLGIREDGTYTGVEPCFEIDIPLGMDVQRAIASLPEFDQAVAEGLAIGMNREAIARKLGCQWKTVDRAVQRIGRHFEELGIDVEGEK